MASPPPPPRLFIGEQQQQLLPDEIMEDIFLRFDSGADLARASTTCRAFHRIATNPLFLRRFLSLHPPPIVGYTTFFRNGGLIQAKPPHRGARAARAVAEAGDFTFSFLPGASESDRIWRARDARDGRFLLSRKGAVPAGFFELMVCDPLYRRYVQIPPIPSDLVPREPPSAKMDSQPFLAPAEEGEPYFRIIYNWLSKHEVVSFVFSSATGIWRCATSFSPLDSRLINSSMLCVRYYARNCFFWVCRGKEDYMLMLDPRKMRFSFVELLTGTNGPPPRQLNIVIMDAPDKDRLGLLIMNRHGLATYSRTCQNNGAGEAWRPDKVVPFPEDYTRYMMMFAAEGYMLIQGFPSRSLPLPRPQNGCFAVDLKTLVVEKLRLMDFSNIGDAHPYASLPPPFALPSLPNCKDTPPSFVY